MRLAGRYRRVTVVAAGLLASSIATAAFGPGLPASAAGAPLAFGSRQHVMDGGGEPSLAIGPDGALYVSTLSGVEDSVAKSVNDGRTWTETPHPNTPLGGDDDHIVVGPDNTVYLAGQWIAGLCESVAVGLHGGMNWVTSPVACALPPTDRPWLAVSRHGLVGYALYIYFSDPCCIGQQVVMRSDDRGLTWIPVGRFPGDFPGYLVIDDDRQLLLAATVFHQDVLVYRSSDGGRQWTSSRVARLVHGGDGGLNHVFLTRDQAGNLFIAWADDRDRTGSTQIWFAQSADHGRTWSAPLAVTSAPGTHIYPTIAAGSAGRVVVGWYETATAGTPSAPSFPKTARWFPKAAGTWDAMAARPSWSLADITTVSNHTGPLCTLGAACVSARGLLDFFSVQIDANDHANVTWADDTSGRTRIYFARSL